MTVSGFGQSSDPSCSPFPVIFSLYIALSLSGNYMRERMIQNRGPGELYGFGTMPDGV